MAFYNTEMQITGRCSISAKTVITNRKQKLGKTKHAGNPERTALELICQKKELNSKDTLCWEKYGEIQGKYFHKLSGKEVLH